MPHFFVLCAKAGLGSHCVGVCVGVCEGGCVRVGVGVNE